MKPPSTGQLVRVRTRHWLVGAVDPSVHGTLVKLSCVDDDAQGEQVEVVWEVELDAVILDGEAWDKLGKRDFDRTEYFAAYLNTLRWNCVTSTNEKLYSPELNPVEGLWDQLKDSLCNRVFPSLSNQRDIIVSWLQSWWADPRRVRSLIPDWLLLQANASSGNIIPVN